MLRNDGGQLWAHLLRNTGSLGGVLGSLLK